VKEKFVKGSMIAEIPSCKKFVKGSVIAKIPLCETKVCDRAP
jgi:hypothetical protein